MQSEHAQKGLNIVFTGEGKGKTSASTFDILILDEITFLFSLGWLDVQECINWVRENKPPSMHLVWTGRCAPPALIDFADLVTEMKLIKHPLTEQGLPAQPGIDY